MFECVINLSEGRDAARLAAFEHAAGVSFVNRHSDPVHHRSVFTLLGPADQLVSDTRRLLRDALATLDLTAHEGVHPRFGVADVVPFVPLNGATMDDAVALRNDTARWLASDEGVGCFLYGPDTLHGFSTLPEVRARARHGGEPDVPSATRDPRRGYAAVGAREVLMAWNVWLEDSSVTVAKELATAIRSASVRALGLDLGGATQVSCNLIGPATTGPLEVLRRVEQLLAGRGRVARCELVGLAPASVLDALTAGEREACGLDPARTIEAAVAAKY